MLPPVAVRDNWRIGVGELESMSAIERCTQVIERPPWARTRCLRGRPCISAPGQEELVGDDPSTGCLLFMLPPMPAN